MTPQPNPLVHIDRFERLLHQLQSRLVRLQNSTHSSARSSVFVPILISKLHLQKMESDYSEIHAMTQVMRSELENIVSSLRTDGTKP